MCLILGSGIRTVLAEYQPQLAYDDKKRPARKDKGINIQLLIESKLSFRYFHPAHEVLVYGNNCAQETDH